MKKIIILIFLISFFKAIYLTENEINSNLTSNSIPEIVTEEEMTDEMKEEMNQFLGIFRKKFFFCQINFSKKYTENSERLAYLENIENEPKILPIEEKIVDIAASGYSTILINV